MNKKLTLPTPRKVFHSHSHFSPSVLSCIKKMVKEQQQQKTNTRMKRRRQRSRGRKKRLVLMEEEEEKTEKKRKEKRKKDIYIYKLKEAKKERTLTSHSATTVIPTKTLQVRKIQTSLYIINYAFGNSSQARVRVLGWEYA